MLAIPNLADAAFPQQAAPFATDIRIILDGLRGHGVIQGCAVTAQGSPNMTVAVAAGTIQVNGLHCREVAAGNVTVSAAHSTLDRIDMICADEAGAKQIIAGTAAGIPVAPALTAGYVGLAAVYVAAADTDVDANQIIDKRAELSPAQVLGPGVTRILNNCISTATPGFTAAFTGVASAVTEVASLDHEWAGLDLDAGTGTTGRASLLSTNLALIRFGAGEAWGAAHVKSPAALSDGTTRYTLRVLFIDANANDPTDGVFFRYVDNVNTGKWQAVTRSNGTETATDTGVAVVADTVYLLEAKVNSDGTSVAFSINGAVVATNTTNIPAASGRETGLGALIQKSAGASARVLKLLKLDAIHKPLNLYG